MNIDTYGTQDFYLSAFLLTKGHPVVDYERSRNITTFQFEKTRELLTLVQEFYSEQGVVNAIRFGNSIKNLKSLIYSITPTTNNDNSTNHKSGF
jgi:Domain of unknown function (DUF5659)